METRISLPYEEWLRLEREALSGILAAGIVHAFNNSLSGIVGQVDVLLWEKDATKLGEELERLSGLCDQTAHLVRHFREVMSTLQSSSPLDGAQLVNSLQIVLERLYRRMGILWSWDVRDEGYLVETGNFFTQMIFHLFLGLKARLNVSSGEPPQFQISYKVNNTHPDKTIASKKATISIAAKPCSGMGALTCKEESYPNDEGDRHIFIVQTIAQELKIQGVGFEMVIQDQTYQGTIYWPVR